MSNFLSTLVNVGVGAGVGYLTGGPAGAVVGGIGGLSSAQGSRRANRLGQFATAPYESGQIQGFLPPALRESQTGAITQEGIARIGELIRRPGGLSPNVAEAILPRLAAESESIAQNFRGIRSQQAGAAARGNLPISIKTALDSALDVAQERAQRGARRTALTESEQLRRQDSQQLYALLDAMLQFTSSGRGQGITGINAANQQANQNDASFLALLGSLLQNSGGGSSAGRPVLGGLTPSGVSGATLVDG